MELCNIFADKIKVCGGKGSVTKTTMGVKGANPEAVPSSCVPAKMEQGNHQVVVLCCYKDELLIAGTGNPLEQSSVLESKFIVVGSNCERLFSEILCCAKRKGKIIFPQFAHLEKSCRD